MRGLFQNLTAEMLGGFSYFKPQFFKDIFSSEKYLFITSIFVLLY